MNTQLTTNSPITVSAYSDIKTRLAFLGGIIQNTKDADTQTVIISSQLHVNRVNEKDQEYTCLRFCTSNFEIYTEVPILSRFKKPVLGAIVEVNLYDLLTFVNSDLDDSITFFVHGDELIVGSFNSPELDMNQLEVRLKILRRYENIPDPKAGDVLFARLEASDFFSLTRELTTLNRHNDIRMRAFENTLHFETTVPGLYTELDITRPGYTFSETQRDFIVPSRLFGMIGVCGLGTDIKIMLRYNRLVVESAEYVFNIPVTECFDVVTPPAPKTEEFGKITVDRKVFTTKLAWFENMNSPNPNKNVNIARYSDTIAEITADYVGRYSMSFLMSAAVELKSDFNIHLPLFVNWFKDERVDAVQLQILDNGDIVSTSEQNGVRINRIYNHSAFIADIS